VSWTNKVVIHFSTYGGAYAKTAVMVASAVIDPSGLVVGAIRTAIAAVQTCVSDKATIVAKGRQNNTTTDAAYENAEDKCTLELLDVEGSAHCWKIPMPKTDLFADDMESGLVAEPPLSTLVSAIGGFSVSRGGSPLLVGTAKARRIRRKATQKK